MPDQTAFAPTRTAALARLSDFIPHAGRDYAARRNYDLGAGRHEGVSTLSPYLRHRLLTEEEVLRATLGRHSHSAAEKFIQEVFWRTYFKGWLEMRPPVWGSYRAGLRQALDQVQTQAGLRRAWEDACAGHTGIDCFDHWAQELAATGYLHNHARMWFASIWIFTLRLPWELGADFFLRHLLDGDPASNTLGWRWVAGLQTPGKTYLARPSNIARYTEGRFQPTGLASEAPPPDAPAHPPRMAPPAGDAFDPAQPTAFLLHDDDLSPAWLFDQGLRPLGTATLDASSGLSPLHLAAHVPAFKRAAMQDCTTRWADRLGPLTPGLSDAKAVTDWAQSIGATQIVTAYAPVGPNADLLNQIRDIPVRRVLRPYDAAAWPHATAGFFKFKDKIAALLGNLRDLRAA